MFVFPLTTLSTSSDKAIRSKVADLCRFSAACEARGLHPAQGMRVARRQKHPVAAQINGKLENAVALAEQVHMRVAPARQTVLLETVATPDHFLLQTMLPESITQVKGYVSPVLDIQPDVHFVRTQRRFNKRRYSRVRVSSRPSFWTGMMLSTVATGAFWGSTIQATDWLTTALIVPDPSMLMLVGYGLISYRFWTLYMRASAPYYREFNKARQSWATQVPLV